MEVDGIVSPFDELMERASNGGYECFMLRDGKLVPYVANSTPECPDGVLNCAACYALRHALPNFDRVDPCVKGQFATLLSGTSIIPLTPEQLYCPSSEDPDPPIDWLRAQGKSLEQRGTTRYQALTNISARLSGLSTGAGLARTDPNPAAAVSSLLCRLDAIRNDLEAAK